MDTRIMRVVQQGEAFAVPSRKTESGPLNKCNIVLRELGGQTADQYAAALLGGMATFKFYPMELVAVKLRFSTREYNGQVFQDIRVADIAKLAK